VVTVAGAPPATIVPVASGGTSNRVSVRPPAFTPCGSTTRAYVPVDGNACVSRKPPVVPTVVEAWTLPSGFTSETFVVQQLVAPTVTSVTARLIRCPAVPSKVRRAFCPGVPTETPTGAPPGEIVPVTSAGTS
jgi:hypothetical protein